MKTHKSPLIPILLACFSSALLHGQFSVDFSSAQGYADGNLNANPDWTEPVPGAFTVDTSGTGSVILTPASGFQSATYSGSGGALSSNTYSTSVVFTLDYSADTTGALLTPAANRLLGRIDFSGGGEADANMRQLAAGPGLYDLALYSDIPGSGKFLGGSDAPMTAAEIGLAHDDTNWTDAVSDPLQLVHYMIYDAGASSWTQVVTLTNLTTGNLLYFLSQPLTEDDNSFRDTNNALRLSTGNIHLIGSNLKLSIDSVTAAVDAEVPSEPEPPAWAGYPIVEDGVSVDTGMFLGWLDILNGPWVWSYSLDHYIYLPEEHVTESGAWTYIPR